MNSTKKPKNLRLFLFIYALLFLILVAEAYGKFGFFQTRNNASNSAKITKVLPVNRK